MALAAAFPATTLQTCLVHLIRNSVEFANGKERKPLAAALRPISTAASADAALTAREAFEHGPWGVRFPTVVAAWRRAWMQVIPFFAFPPEVRRVIYTTYALESVHARHGAERVECLPAKRAWTLPSLWPPRTRHRDLENRPERGS